MRKEISHDKTFPYLTVSVSEHPSKLPFPVLLGIYSKETGLYLEGVALSKDGVKELINELTKVL